jgi:hypothetical protein
MPTKWPAKLAKKDEGVRGRILSPLAFSYQLRCGIASGTTVATSVWSSAS